jgi:hypothetical protein
MQRDASPTRKISITYSHIRQEKTIPLAKLSEIGKNAEAVSYLSLRAKDDIHSLTINLVEKNGKILEQSWNACFDELLNLRESAAADEKKESASVREQIDAEMVPLKRQKEEKEKNIQSIAEFEESAIRESHLTALDKGKREADEQLKKKYDALLLTIDENWHQKAQWFCAVIKDLWTVCDEQVVEEHSREAVERSPESICCSCGEKWYFAFTLPIKCPILRLYQLRISLEGAPQVHFPEWYIFNNEVFPRANLISLFDQIDLRKPIDILYVGFLRGMYGMSWPVREKISATMSIVCAKLLNLALKFPNQTAMLLQFDGQYFMESMELLPKSASNAPAVKYYHSFAAPLEPEIYQAVLNLFSKFNAASN